MEVSFLAHIVKPNDETRWRDTVTNDTELQAALVWRCPVDEQL